MTRALTPKQVQTLEDRAISYLALLEMSGYKIRAWDWQNFAKDSGIATEACINTVKLITKSMHRVSRPRKHNEGTHCTST